jgi:hypothetical protein
VLPSQKKNLLVRTLFDLVVINMYSFTNGINHLFTTTDVNAEAADVEKKGAAEHKETYAEAAKQGLEEGGDKPAAEAAQA